MEEDVPTRIAYVRLPTELNRMPTKSNRSVVIQF